MFFKFLAVLKEKQLKLSSWYKTFLNSKTHKKNEHISLYALAFIKFSATLLSFGISSVYFPLSIPDTMETMLLIPSLIYQTNLRIQLQTCPWSTYCIALAPQQAQSTPTYHKFHKLQ